MFYESSPCLLGQPGSWNSRKDFTKPCSQPDAPDCKVGEAQNDRLATQTTPTSSSSSSSPAMSSSSSRNLLHHFPESSRKCLVIPPPPPHTTSQPITISRKDSSSSSEPSCNSLASSSFGSLIASREREIERETGHDALCGSVISTCK